MLKLALHPYLNPKEQYCVFDEEISKCNMLFFGEHILLIIKPVCK